MPLLLSSKPAGASEEGGGSEAKAKATPTIAAAMKVLMVFSPTASESTVREPRLVHGRHIGGGQEPKVGAARLVDHQASSGAGTPRAVMLLSAWGDATFKVVQFPRQVFVP